jgi:hypothetical protein
MPKNRNTKKFKSQAKRKKKVKDRYVTEKAIKKLAKQAEPGKYYTVLGKIISYTQLQHLAMSLMTPEELIAEIDKSLELDCSTGKEVLKLTKKYLESGEWTVKKALHYMRNTYVDNNTSQTQ